MTAYYNEIDPKAAATLRELIKRGVIAPGVVDDRSIVDVRPADLKDLASVISSQAQGSGAMRLSLRAGTIAALCGAALAHASLSARQAKALGSLTSGISGPRGSTLLNTQSREVYRSLESRLRAQTDSFGSSFAPRSLAVRSLRCGLRRAHIRHCINDRKGRRRTRRRRAIVRATWWQTRSARALSQAETANRCESLLPYFRVSFPTMWLTSLLFS